MQSRMQSRMNEWHAVTGCCRTLALRCWLYTIHTFALMPHQPLAPALYWAPSPRTHNRQR